MSSTSSCRRPSPPSRDQQRAYRSRTPREKPHRIQAPIPCARDRARKEEIRRAPLRRAENLQVRMLSPPGTPLASRLPRGIQAVHSIRRSRHDRACRFRSLVGRRLRRRAGASRHARGRQGRLHRRWVGADLDRPAVPGVAEEQVPPVAGIHGGACSAGRRPRDLLRDGVSQCGRRRGAHHHDVCVHLFVCDEGGGVLDRPGARDRYEIREVSRHRPGSIGAAHRRRCRGGHLPRELRCPPKTSRADSPPDGGFARMDFEHSERARAYIDQVERFVRE